MIDSCWLSLRLVDGRPKYTSTRPQPRGSPSSSSSSLILFWSALLGCRTRNVHVHHSVHAQPTPRCGAKARCLCLRQASNTVFRMQMFRALRVRPG